MKKLFREYKKFFSILTVFMMLIVMFATSAGVLVPLASEEGNSGVVLDAAADAGVTEQPAAGEESADSQSADEQQPDSQNQDAQNSEGTDSDTSSEAPAEGAADGNQADAGNNQTEIPGIIPPSDIVINPENEGANSEGQDIASNDDETTEEGEAEDTEDLDEADEEIDEETVEEELVDGKKLNALTDITDFKDIVTNIGLFKMSGNQISSDTFTGADTDVPLAEKVALRFEYTIPAGKHIEENHEYSFTVSGAIKAQTIDFIIKAADGSEVATGIASSNGGNTDIKITFNDTADAKYRGEEASPVSGWFWVAANFDKDQLGAGGKQKVRVEVDGTAVYAEQDINFVQQQPQVDITTQKWGNVDAENGKIDWTVTTNPSISQYKAADKDSATKQIVITDTLPKGLVMSGSTVLVNDVAVTPVVTANPDGTTTIVATIDSSVDSGNLLKPGNWPLVTKISTAYSNDTDTYLQVQNNAITFKNDAKSEIEGYKYAPNASGELELDTDPSAETLKKDHSTSSNVNVSVAGISKNYKIAGNKIVWTIEVSNKTGAPNTFIKDTMANCKLATPVTVEYKESSQPDTAYAAMSTGTTNDASVPVYNVTDPTAGNEMYIYLPPLAKTYTVRYSTVKSGSDGDISNTAKYFYDPGTGADPVNWGTASGNTQIDTGAAQISKTAGNYDRATHTVNWTTTLNVKDAEVGTTSMTIEDKFGATKQAGSLVVTDTVEQRLDGDVTVKTAGGTVFTAGTDYSFTDNTDGFTIVFTTAGLNKLTESTGIATDDVVLTYTTKLTDGTDATSNARKYWGDNSNGTAVSNGVTLTAEGLLEATITATAQTWAYSKIFEKGGPKYNAGNYDAATHTATWYLYVNENQQKMTGIKIVDTMKKVEGGSRVATTDWAYVEDSFKVLLKKDGVADVDKTAASTISIDPVTRVLTMILPDVDANDGKYEVTYKTRYDMSDDTKAAELSNNKTVKDYVNEAVLTATEGVTPDGVKVENGVTISGKGALDKTIASQVGRKIIWKVDVNKNYGILRMDTANSAPVSLVDTLEEGLTFAGISAKKYPKDDVANPVDLVKDTDYTASYDGSTRTLTIAFKTSANVPDANKLTDRYEIYITTVASIQKKYKNKIKLAGAPDDAGYDDESEESAEVNLADGGTDIDGFGNLTLTKKNEGGATITEAGYKFNIYKKTGGAYSTTPAAVLVTDATGKASVTVEAGTYRVEEIEVPAASGYELNTTPKDDVVVLEKQDNYVEFVNKAKITTTTVKVSKRVLGQGSELAGALLYVYKTTGAGGTIVKGSEVTHWISGTTAKQLELEDGVYILEESQAPLGYNVAERIIFKVEDGAVTIRKTNGTYAAPGVAGTVIMNDAVKTKTVNISKVAAGQPGELAGAKLGVYEDSYTSASVHGTTVAEWTSTGTARQITVSYSTPECPKEYVLVENQAPTGYDIAEKITFKVGTDGKVYIKQSNGTYALSTAGENTVRMTDNKTGENGTKDKASTTVTKTNSGTTLKSATGTASTESKLPKTAGLDVRFIIFILGLIFTMSGAMIVLYDKDGKNWKKTNR